MGIQIRDVFKTFGRFRALREINLHIKENSLVALLGPSGSGKSTLLRAIAGLEPPDQGQIIINGQDTTYLDVRRRNIGFVFQHYALFKEMTIRENIAFGLDVRRVAPAQKKQRVEELLALIKLEGLGDRYPNQLSGGQRQRVALARALAVNPQVLLLDEPFGALDAKIRKELRAWLRHLHQEIPVTTVFVTHDQEEAMEVADEIVIMNQGKIEQVGTTADIYDHPANAFVMGFIGAVNVMPPHSRFVQEILAENPRKPLFVRPHEMQILVNPSPQTAPAIIQRVTFLGAEIRLQLADSEGFDFDVYLHRNHFDHLALKVGQQIFIKPLAHRFFNEAAFN